MQKAISFSLIFLLGLTPFVYAGDTTDLQGVWYLEESNGTRYDEWNNRNNLTDNNTVLSAGGQFGGAGDFETANSEQLDITDASQVGLDVTGDITFGGFINIESAAASGVILGKRDGPSSNRGYYFYIDTTPDEHCGFSSDGAGETDFGDGTPALSTATWYHVVCRLSGTTTNIYRDGTSVATTTHTGGLFNNTARFSIGSTNTTPAAFFDGLIDEAFVFSRALTTAEIDDIRLNGLRQFIGRQQRIFGISGVVQFFTIITYWRGVNLHKLKFNLSRPAWMKVFELPEVFAQTAEEVLVIFRNKDSEEETNKNLYGKYKQELVKDLPGPFTIETHEYVGPRGVGYVQIAKRNVGTKKERLMRHVGVEVERPNDTTWQSNDDTLN